LRYSLYNLVLFAPVFPSKNRWRLIYFFEILINTWLQFRFGFNACFTQHEAPYRHLDKIWPCPMLGRKGEFKPVEKRE